MVWIGRIFEEVVEFVPMDNIIIILNLIVGLLKIICNVWYILLFCVWHVYISYNKILKKKSWRSAVSPLLMMPCFNYYIKFIFQFAD